MISVLKDYHPLIIEGMGGYDSRDPDLVAQQIVIGLHEHWSVQPPKTPITLVTQGDPYDEKGISAITRRVADKLDILRALVYLDPEIADYHLPNADLYKVKIKIQYSHLVQILETSEVGFLAKLSAGVRASLEEKNAQRRTLEKAALPQYFYDFAMFQEVTKIACKQICQAVTVAHTSCEISPFSVTSFYNVGLELGLTQVEDIVPYKARADL